MTVDTALAAAERLGHVGDIYVRAINLQTRIYFRL